MIDKRPCMKVLNGLLFFGRPANLIQFSNKLVLEPSKNRLSLSSFFLNNFQTLVARMIKKWTWYFDTHQKKSKKFHRRCELLRLVYVIDIGLD